MGVQTGLMTVEEFLKLKDPKEGRYELHHGEVVLVPPPKWGHVRFQRRLQRLLDRLVGDKGVATIEMPFRPTSEHEVWVADVGFLRDERAESVGDDEYPMGAPDLVVEVLSPGNTMDEMNDRIAICMKNGCSSFWIVDPKRNRISVTEGDITRHYGSESSFHCGIIDATVPVSEIFA
jgi:Uma2 family endonuclease